MTTTADAAKRNTIDAAIEIFGTHEGRRYKLGLVTFDLPRPGPEEIRRLAQPGADGVSLSWSGKWELPEGRGETEDAEYIRKPITLGSPIGISAAHYLAALPANEFIGEIEIPVDVATTEVKAAEYNEGRVARLVTKKRWTFTQTKED